MISPFFDRLRRLCAPALVTLLVSLTVAVPMLDRAERRAGPVLESEHNPSTCVRVHDHTVCTQYGSNLQFPSDAPRQGSTPHETAAQAPAAVEIAVAHEARAPARSRAPPIG